MGAYGRRKGHNQKTSLSANVLWRFAERCGAKGVSLIVSIILARLLMPEAYGTISLVTVFTSILNVFVDCGMGISLVQKKDADELDFSTVFYFNAAICGILYFVMFLIAPYIAAFYGISELTAVVRVLSLTIVVSGIRNVQQAYVTRNMLFKRFFWATLGGTIGAAAIGITMAYLGFGVWALVAQHLFNTTVDTIILWVTVKWRPKGIFSLKRLKGLLRFGGRIFASSLLGAAYSDIRQLIIGKMYSSKDLAYYNRGKQTPNMVIENLSIAVDSVLFPVMSKAQEDVKRVREIMSRSIKLRVYVTAPLLMGMAFAAPALVDSILTDKWSACIPYLRIFCFSNMLYPLSWTNQDAIKATGRSDLYLRQDIVRKAVGLVLLLIAMWFGVMAIAYSLLLDSIIELIICALPAKKLFGYSFLEQIRDALFSILLAVFMGICISFIPLLGCPSAITLFMQIILGAGIYIGGSIAMKNDSWFYLWNILKTNIKKNKLTTH